MISGLSLRKAVVGIYASGAFDGPLRGRLLGRIERSNFNVLEKRIRVPTWEKLSILASAALR